MSPYWRTVTVDVLSEGETRPVFESLEQVAYQISEGDCPGRCRCTCEELTPNAMADALLGHGADPSFLGLDDDGHESAQEREP